MPDTIPRSDPPILPLARLSQRQNSGVLRALPLFGPPHPARARAPPDIG